MTFMAILFVGHVTSLVNRSYVILDYYNLIVMIIYHHNKVIKLIEFIIKLLLKCNHTLYIVRLTLVKYKQS